MTTTIVTLHNWFKEGVRRKADFMVVKCDTFDYEDYPVYSSRKTVHKEVAEPGSMQRVMEVYDLSKPWDSNPSRQRKWQLPK